MKQFLKRLAKVILVFPVLIITTLQALYYCLVWLITGRQDQFDKIPILAKLFDW